MPWQYNTNKDVVYAEKITQLYQEGIDTQYAMIVIKNKWKGILQTQR